MVPFLLIGKGGAERESRRVSCYVVEKVMTNS